MVTIPKTGTVIATASHMTYEKTYTQSEVEKLLAGINMLGGDICPLCGTVKIKKTRCPICKMGKYL